MSKPIAFLRSCAVAFPLLMSGAAGAQDMPVVVELFTSQGCSSCPPADALLGELARRKDVLALGFHVNYWDRLGWADPFASAESTERQRAYARAFRRSNVYTPQMVVGGTAEMVGSRRREVIAAIERPAVQDRLEVRLVRGADGWIAVSIPPLPGGPVDVWFARYDAENTTNILRGENADRRLIDVNAVRQFGSLGSIQERALDRRLEPPPPGGGLAVWAQEPGPGQIVGAAKIEAAR